MNKNIYVAYLHGCGLSHSELRGLLGSGMSAKELFEGMSEESLREQVKNAERRGKILEQRRVIKTQKIDSTVDKLSVRLICLDDEEYPESLKNIPHTPYILYVRGEIPKQDMFGVVGSRKISSYGKKVISQLVPDISKIFPIVSGGAAGCDTCAHRAALESGNPTVVVVGTGIDETYPVSNEKLFTQIAESGGAIVSIFRIGEVGNPYNFPVRNEIVVGLSRGVLVVEAQSKSGSLITAGLSLDLGKDLFAIPGDITSSQSGGTNALIKKGEAKCVTSSMDILEEYDVLIKQSAHKQQLPLLDELESKLYQCICDEQRSIDDLCKLLSMESREVGIKLSMLELKNVIKKDISGKYMLI